ncbi:MAG: hypothetical protein WD512_11770 [Candidatus Paceibacterota bacterium]
MDLEPHPFNNRLIIEKIFQYIKIGRHKYVNITRNINKYIFETVLVEFSIDKYLIWLISSKSYEPQSFTQFLYWKMVPIYIPSKIMDNIECLLKYLRMEYYKRVRVVLSNHQTEKYQISAVELSNRMSVFIMHNDLNKYFNNIEELIVRGMTINFTTEKDNLKIKYLDLQRTRIEGTLPTTLETLIIDIGVLELKKSDLILPRLKNLYLTDGDNRIRTNKYLEALNWHEVMPKLEVLMIGHCYFKLNIDLSLCTNLKKVYYMPVRDPSNFLINGSAQIIVYNNSTKKYVDPIFTRNIFDQQQIFNIIGLTNMQ